MKKIEFKSLSQLQEEKGESNLTYADKLSTSEWREFRREILNRDNMECQICRDRPNEYMLAWELKGSAPFDIFVRPASDYEKNILGKDLVYSGERIFLNAHHKYYIKNKNPWEYNPEALITVCSKCHTKIHETEDIFTYENEQLENPKIIEKCWKCGGTGYLGQYHYYLHGICFACNGKGTIE